MSEVSRFIRGIEGPDRIYCYLCNFWPRIVHGNGSYRELVKQIGWLDKTPRQALGDEASLSEHSPRFVNQTYREFFNTIDSTMAELGVSADEITELYRGIRRDRDARQRDMRRFNTLALPVYLRLRQMGYSILDLNQ